MISCVTRQEFFLSLFSVKDCDCVGSALDFSTATIINNKLEYCSRDSQGVIIESLSH